MNRWTWFGIGTGIGVCGALFLDPARGAARRAKAKDKARSLGRQAVEGTRHRLVDLKWRAQGTLHELKARLEEKGVPDDILAERVKAQIGRPVRHPGALEIDVRDGMVEVKGPVLAQEVPDLLWTIRMVRGVKGVVNRLQVHPSPENISSLQGAGSRQTH